MGRKRKLGRREPNGRVHRSHEPGRAVLDEDKLSWVTGSFHLPKQKRAHKGPVATETAMCSIIECEERIMRAMRTLRAMPDKERRFFVLKSGMPAHVQEQIDAYAAVDARPPRFAPTPFDVGDYLTALSWARHLPRNQWRILWWRSFGLSFGQIAAYIGRSDETARRNFKEAIIDAWTAANGYAGSRAA